LGASQTDTVRSIGPLPETTREHHQRTVQRTATNSHDGRDLDIQ